MSWRDALEEALGGAPEVVLEVSGAEILGGHVTHEDAVRGWSALAEHAGAQGRPVILGMARDVTEHVDRAVGSTAWLERGWVEHAGRVYESLGEGVSLADLNDEEEGPGALRAASFGATTLPTGPLEASELMVGVGTVGAALTLAWSPAQAWWELPIALRFGGVDDNPPPWVHAGLLRKWEEEWGAEVVTLGRDVMELRVRRAPSTWPAAFELAQEQLDFCPALVRRGVGTLKNLASGLKTARVWTFVWV